MVNGTSIDALNEVRTWLEWAGARLLSMNISSPAPKEFGSSWPEIADDHKTAYGYTGNRLKVALPDSKEIWLMDQVLDLPNLIPDVTARRIVNSRSLVTPVSNRHLYSWSKIAFMTHMDRRRVVKLYFNGLKEIVKRSPAGKIDTLRHTLYPYTH